MIRSLTKRVLGSAAAAVDRVATAAVTAHASRADQRRERPHSELLRVLERLDARFRDAPLDDFFDLPASIAPGERHVRQLGAGGVVTPSIHARRYCR